MLLEDPGEDLLDRFAALRGLAFFTDDLAVRQEQPCDRLGIARIVGLGKGLGGEPDRLLVRLIAGPGADAAVAVPGLAGGSADTLFRGPWATAIATSARATPATVKILRMGFSLSCQENEKSRRGGRPEGLRPRRLTR